MAAFATMLMAVLVVHAPIAIVDQLLHDSGQAHAANAFAGAIIDLAEHGHDGGRHQTAPYDVVGAEGASTAKAATDASSPEPTSALSHHHHDGASVHGLADALNLPVAWSSSATPFILENDLRKGIDGLRQDRPPKRLLDHVA